MTLGETILDRLSAWRPTGDGPHVLRLPIEGGAVFLTADRVDELSSRLNDATIQTGEPAECTAAQLTERAVSIANRVTGLLEPLAVYEIDAARSVALVRSATPAERGDDVFYYELTLTGLHAAGLKRFRAAKSGGKREAVPFVLTHEAVAKVVEDNVG